MADPFEVRMRFTALLTHLNAAVTSSQKAANYALKYREMDEDLHSCILEQLERSSMNNRANIMYFIEHLCDVAQREGHAEYVRMIKRDILRVVDAVAPEDGSGAANVKVIRRVLNGLQLKGVLGSNMVTEIEECLKERDTSPSHHAVLSPAAEHHSHDLASLDPSSNRKATGPGTAASTASITTPQTLSKATSMPSKVDKKQAEQRIEEDRERHKRLREEIWAVDATDDGEAEYQKLLDETSDLCEDDFLLMQEEHEERRACAQEAMAEELALQIEEARLQKETMGVTKEAKNSKVG
ncbi:MAG: hypothetical protein M1826_005094 [Phylliscum demangeonii]|nr:MAG: hypothetical protein M1826_005094 [Phylliscum demangeonii]